MPHCGLKVAIILIILLYSLGIIFLFNFMRFPSTELENYLSNQPRLFRKDWHDYLAMYNDDVRTGPGEHGNGTTLSADVDQELANIMHLKYGFNGLISDMISVNRSLLDQRPEGCQHKKYLAKLPVVSVVMPFYNEYLSVLLRSLHSIINRTPPELLKEIIIVDDCSQFENLGIQLDQYVADHFDKVKILRLSKREGLIRVRMAGLRKATAEVLVIFDSHIEVNYNWLPPLLEQIALNKRTVVSPLIDSISFSNFEYLSRSEGEHGAFRWDLRYRSSKLSPEDLLDKTKPLKNPVMLGGLFAMSADYFWELGGYDEGLDIWGGEQFELSFKIWMCRGQLLDVPCSRVGHLYRDNHISMSNPHTKDYLSKNKKRVAEVWMDEYKHYVYKRLGTNIDKIDAGDLTERKAIREKLKCKSFKWYLEEVAKDVMKFHPPVEPPEYAYGAIQSVASPGLCVDTYSGYKPGLYSCADNLTHPYGNQNFVLSFLRELRWRNTYSCFEAYTINKVEHVGMFMCHHSGDNQFWYYDRKNKWIVHRKNGSKCLEASPSNWKIFTNTCDTNNPNMKWNFGVVMVDLNKNVFKWFN